MNHNQTSRWFHPRWTLILSAYIGFLALVSLVAYQGAIPAALDRIPYYDKLGHFLLIGTSGYIAHRALRRRGFKVGLFTLPIGPTIVAALTFVDEGFQYFSPDRSLSTTDVIANLLGLVVFCGIDHILTVLKSEFGEGKH